VHHLIRRGAREIGGMCIEVAADDHTRILLDLGMPLQMPDGGDFPRGTPQRPTRELIAEGVLVDVPGVFPHDPATPDVAAIVLTHSHLDHCGLAHHAHPAIPVYGSRGTLAVLDVGRVFFPDAALPVDLRLLPDDEPLRAGGLTVTAIPVDHAAPDSRALLCESDGQRLLYTGDLRAHGRTGFRFEKLLADEHVRGVDWLLCEGTTLGSSGGSHGLRSEADVEEELVALARHEPDKLIAVAASGQNLDRLVSCFRAARRARRQLVVDAYQAYVLRQLALLSPSIPQVDWNGVRVKFAHHQVQRLEQAGLMGLAYEMRDQAYLGTPELVAHPERFLMSVRGSAGVTRLFDRVGPDRVVLVWSLWGGYWERNERLRAWAGRVGREPHFIHSGGHAWPEDLKRLVAAVQPKSPVIWVHTDVGPHPRDRDARPIDFLPGVTHALSASVSAKASPTIQQ
jgi:ribonuclease J